MFTLIIHGGILYFIVFGISVHQEKLEAKGKPVQAVVVSQLELARKEEEKQRHLRELERQRQDEERHLAEEKQRQQAEALKKEQARKRREFLLNHCEKLVLEEERAGEINHELDGLCDQERVALKKQRQEEERQRKELALKQKAEAERQRQAEAEKKRQLEEERRRQAEAEKKRQVEEEKRRQAEAEKKRQAEERRRLDEQKLKAQLQAEQEARLAAETEKAATDALSAAAGRIRAAIEANWRRPSTSLRGLKVVIGLRVGRNGEVKNARIVKSSGDVHFDESAELAVQKASPLPIPTEAEYYQYIKEFHIEFNPDE